MPSARVRIAFSARASETTVAAFAKYPSTAWERASTAVAFVMLIFTTKSTWWFIIIYTIFYNCSVAGTNQNSFNISYSYVDSKYITQAMAIKNSIGGICGFGASILGGKILEMIQKNGNSIFGLHIYGQQVLGGISLFILSFVSCSAATLYAGLCPVKHAHLFKRLTSISGLKSSDA